MTHRIFALLTLVAGCALDAEASESSSLGAADAEEPRHDLFEAETAAERRLASADLFGSWRDDLRRRSDGDFDLLSDPFTTIAEPPPEVPLCSDASFYGQPRLRTGASNVLVGEDLVLTAHHTMPNETVCAARALILDHALTEPTDPSRTHPIVPAENVYYCDEIVADGLATGGDWALFRLDRPVDGRHLPIPLRRSGAALELADAFIAGHPHRLPLKFEHGTVSTGTHSVYGIGHVTPGSSGSMVVDQASGRLVGLVTTGMVQRILDPREGCYRECVSPGCYEWYGGVSVGLAASSVPPIGLDVSPPGPIAHYGPSGGPFDPTEVITSLEAGRAGRALAVDVSLEGEELLIVTVLRAATGPIALPPGASLSLGVSLDEHAAASLPLGAYDAAVRFDERVYGTSDVRAHRVLVGVEGFAVETVAALRDVTYALTNRYVVAQEVRITADAAWLRLNGGGARLSMLLPPSSSDAPIPTLTVDRDPNVPPPPVGTEAAIEMTSGGREAWHSEQRHVLWDGERLVALD